MKINDILVEFAPSDGGGDSGNYFQALASAWYNGTFDTGSLQKGIKSQEDVERLLNRGIVCPDGKTRKLHIDYNSDFDGVEIYSDDYYEHGDHDATIDSRTGQKWGPYDFMAFSDEDLSEGVSEGVRTESAELAKQYGWAYNQGEYGASMTHPKHGRISLSSPVTSRSGDTAVEREWTHNNASGIGDRSLAQHLQSLREQGVAKGSLNEFAPDSNDGGEEDALHKYARMWWAGDEATQMQIERALAKMGWEIGEDEGGYDNGGVFVVRAGDVNGNSYTSWAAEDLTEGAPISGDGGAVDNFRQQMANNTEIAYKKGVAEGNRKSEPPEADYGDDYQDMVKRVKRLAGVGPLKTVYDPNRRVYRNMPTAVQPRK